MATTRRRRDRVRHREDVGSRDGQSKDLFIRSQLEQLAPTRVPRRLQALGERPQSVQQQRLELVGDYRAQVECTQNLLHEIRTVGAREERIKALRDTGPATRFLAESKSCDVLASTPLSVKVLDEHQMLTGGPSLDLHHDHEEFRKQVAKLKDELKLMRGALGEIQFDKDVRKIFDQLTLRARYLDLVWASHLERIKAFCRELEQSVAADHSRLAQGYAQRLRVMQLQQELEMKKLMNQMEQKSRDQAYMMSLLRSQQGSSQKLLEDSDNDAKDKDDENAHLDEDDGMWSWSPAEAPHNPDEDDLLGLNAALDPRLRDRVLETLSAVDLGLRVGKMDRNDLAYLVSQLKALTKQALLESLLHGSSGQGRLNMLKEFLLEGDLMLELSGDDTSLMGTVLDNMAIDGRMRLLLQILQASNVAGMNGQSNLTQFEEATQEYLKNGGMPNQVAPGLERNSSFREKSISAPQTGRLPYVSIHLDGGLVHLRGHAPTVDVGVGPDGDAGRITVRSENSLEARLRELFETGQPNAMLEKLSIKHAERYIQASKDSQYSVKISISSSKSGSGDAKAMFSSKPHPWTKFLRASKKKQGRDVNIDTVISDVYSAKVLLDQDFRQRGERKPLCNVVMDYFTQKYGLRKLAREYTHGLVKTLRQHAAQSKRAEVFGIACGVLRESMYSPVVGDVLAEFLAQLSNGNSDSTHVLLSKGEGNAFQPLSAVLSAINSVFLAAERLDNFSKRTSTAPPVLNTEVLVQQRDATVPKKLNSPGKGKGKKNSVAASPGNAHRGTVFISSAGPGGEVKRSWTMPSAIRQSLTAQLEAIAKPASEVSALKENGSVLYCNVDAAMDILLNIFLEKLHVDRCMLMHLFSKYDLDNNGVLSLEEFTELLTHCQLMEPLDEEGVMDLWNKVNDNEDDDDDSDNITKEGFATVCIAQGLQFNYWKLQDVKEKLDEILIERGIVGGKSSKNLAELSDDVREESLNTNDNSIPEDETQED